ncbi:MAG: hypothetical protein ACFFBQ_13655 [Promethearchaeota archaeon]
MRIEQFASIYLEFKSPVALEVYQGYLIAGELKSRKPRCFWINKQNIEGIAEVAKIIAIESAFHGLLSLIPGGSFAYRLIKDQIGYPPRFNMIFEPNYYTVTYSTVALNKKGERKGMINGLVQSIDDLAKIAYKTGSKLQDTILEFISKEKPISNSEGDDDILGFTYIRFDDKTTIIRNRIVEDRLSKTKSTPTRLAQTALSEIVPPVVVSFKTTANEEAVNFLQYLNRIGFKVNFSQASFDKTEP